jgi:predicted amidohydrolase YtcJ
MTNFLRSVAALCILSGFLLAAPPPTIAQPSAPELILYNGKIFTSNLDHPYVQALAIRGNRILATGDSAKMLALRGPGTRTIDLRGRTTIPGINDAHVHLDIESANEVKLPIDGENRRGENPTLEQVMTAITASIKKADPKSLLTATVGPAIYFDPRMTRSALDTVAPNNPVMLTTLTGHAAFLNSAALRLFGIREDQPDPMGGRYERGPDGKLDGVVREYALFDLERQIADGTSDTEALQQLRAQLDQAAKFGITTIQDMSNGMPPARAVALLEKLPPTTRVRVMRMPGTTVTGRDVKEGRPAPRPDSPWITVSGTKWMLDGTPLEGTFESREERAADLSPGRSGKSMEAIFADFGLLFPEPELTAMLHETQHDNDPLLLHVSGYVSASAMLKALQSNGGSDVWSTRRVRFEHGDGLYPEFVPTLKALGIIVVQNPTHLAVAQMIPGLTLQSAQPLRSLLDAGIPVALGSDGPMNPYLNIMLASIDPDRPKEAMTREQAVIAYTLTSAYAEFREKDKGTLEPNKLADLAVLSQDIFSVPPPDLQKTTSVLTIVGGKVVYDSKVLSPQ